MRLVGKPLTADLEEYLPDYRFAFEGVGAEAEGFYYTSQRSRELNAEFGDLLHKIRDFEVSCSSSSHALASNTALDWQLRWIDPQLQ